MVAIVTVTFILLFAIYSESTIPAVAASVEQFLTTVLPSLFPFYVAASVLRRTKLCEMISKKAEKIMQPLFGVSGAGAFALITGLICGYPAGAGMSTELYRDGKLSEEDVIRLSSFVNNTGPLFLIGTVGAGMLGSAKTGAMLWACHIIASFLCGVVMCNIRRVFVRGNAISVRIPPKAAADNVPADDKTHFGKIISDAMTSSMFTMIPIAAAVVFFAAFNAVCEASGVYNIIARLLADVLPPDATSGILKGALEITGGITQTALVFGGGAEGAASGNMAVLTLISAIAGFSGLSVHFQVAGIYTEARIPSGVFVLGKCLHAVLAAGITFAMFKLILY